MMLMVYFKMVRHQQCNAFKLCKCVSSIVELLTIAGWAKVEGRQCMADTFVSWLQRFERKPVIKGRQGKKCTRDKL